MTTAIPCSLQAIYCTGKLNSEFCVPAMSWPTGAASLTSPNPFMISATGVMANRPGLLFYSTSGRATIPFQGGTLCMNPQVARAPLAYSDGVVGDCSHPSNVISFDFNLEIQAAGGPTNPLILNPGTTVHAQWYIRDPGDPLESSLSDAIEFAVWP